ncbi:unnamed protein product [Nezara viridula]|uniref:Uncharacterized protein n=1 Tax=Nezara viridula TaxID=85310 RepID=A0A9P0H1R4_NEZVI|nr:unnamed protein product [Nezara viridula]
MAPPKKEQGRGRKKMKSIESSEDEEYRRKRDRNNQIVIVDPTIRFETNDQDQNLKIQAAKEKMYTKCIPFLKEKYRDDFSKREFSVKSEEIEGEVEDADPGDTGEGSAVEEGERSIGRED